MNASTQGHTVDEQLELTWSVPPATAATPDFVCWLWAAYPPRQGRLHISRVSQDLGIPPTTLRRWVRSNKPKITSQHMRRLVQRAILRGKGSYLWPDLDPVTQQRAQHLLATATRYNDLILNEPERIPPAWRDNGTLDPHEVHLVQFGRAHAYGVSATRHDKALAKVRRYGTILETQPVTNKYAAIQLKHQVLSRVAEHRCITPKQLVPTGHTETWREAAGETTLDLEGRP